ncbi:MAG: ATP-grasp domain-containing protein, partial [Bdellovibrionales bacterium]|nr:ATP-grasp domain-containing protein [Bdellovibrionales bacterium]
MAKSSRLELIPSITLDHTSLSKRKEAVATFIQQHGLPVVLKATAGGGGRGMRKVESVEQIADNLERASQEAKAFFNNDTLFVEKSIEHARHVEVQFIGDSHGNAHHLLDRDCTWQRRYQKVIEEAPAPNIPAKTREMLFSGVEQLAKSCKYEGLGTAEFLYDTSGKAYFLEVNSRIQVEHPVTESITGLDLVELQIEVARGKALDEILPSVIPCIGHSIECRICAESSDENFHA